MKTYNLAKEIAVAQVYNSDSLSYQIYQTTRTKVVYFDIHREIKQITLQKGRWVELCLAKEMTEEKAKMIMPTLYKEGYEYIYQDFINTENWFNTSLEAFHSFMYSIGMPCHNPYGKEKPTYETVNILEYFKYRKELYAWQEAEAKLVNSLILYKEK